eukprot:PhF_6_TR7029/c0_g1_i1/m.10524
MAELYDDETIEELSCVPSVDALQFYVIWVSLPGTLTVPIRSMYMKSIHRTYCWDAMPDVTVQDIKNFVGGQMNLEPLIMIMCVFCGQLMVDDMYLADYGIGDSNTVLIALRNTIMNQLVSDMLWFTNPVFSLFPNEVLIAENLVLLQFQDDFGVIEPNSKILYVLRIPKCCA